MLQLRVAGLAFDFGVDQLFFLRVDAPIGLGRRNQRAQDGMAVILGLGAGQLIHRADRLLRGCRLAALPALIGLECHHPQRRQGRVIDTACGTPLGRAASVAASAAQQTAQQTTKAAPSRRTATAKQAAKQSTQATLAVLR